MRDDGEVELLRILPGSWMTQVDGEERLMRLHHDAHVVDEPDRGPVLDDRRAHLLHHTRQRRIEARKRRILHTGGASGGFVPQIRAANRDGHGVDFALERRSVVGRGGRGGFRRRTLPLHGNRRASHRDRPEKAASVNFGFARHCRPYLNLKVRPFGREVTVADASRVTGTPNRLNVALTVYTAGSFDLLQLTSSVCPVAPSIGSPSQYH